LLGFFGGNIDIEELKNSYDFSFPPPLLQEKNGKSAGTKKEEFGTQLFFVQH
jgi:hypothetical protein